MSRNAAATEQKSAFLYGDHDTFTEALVQSMSGDEINEMQSYLSSTNPFTPQPMSDQDSDDSDLHFHNTNDKNRNIIPNTALISNKLARTSQEIIAINPIQTEIAPEDGGNSSGINSNVVSDDDSTPYDGLYSALSPHRQCNHAWQFVSKPAILTNTSHSHSSGKSVLFSHVSRARSGTNLSNFREYMEYKKEQIQELKSKILELTPYVVKCQELQNLVDSKQSSILVIKLEKQALLSEKLFLESQLNDCKTDIDFLNNETEIVSEMTLIKQRTADTFIANGQKMERELDYVRNCAAHSEQQSSQFQDELDKMCDRNHKYVNVNEHLRMEIKTYSMKCNEYSKLLNEYTQQNHEFQSKLLQSDLINEQLVTDKNELITQLHLLTFDDIHESREFDTDETVQVRFQAFDHPRRGSSSQDLTITLKGLPTFNSNGSNDSYSSTCNAQKMQLGFVRSTSVRSEAESMNGITLVERKSINNNEDYDFYDLLAIPSPVSVQSHSNSPNVADRTKPCVTKSRSASLGRTVHAWRSIRSPKKRVASLDRILDTNSLFPGKRIYFNNNNNHRKETNTISTQTDFIDDDDTDDDDDEDDDDVVNDFKMNEQFMYQPGRMMGRPVIKLGFWEAFFDSIGCVSCVPMDQNANQYSAINGEQGEEGD